jgi:hypothetical protein
MASLPELETLPKSNAVSILIVTILVWLVLAVILCAILWGAAGYGLWRALAAPRARAFIELINDKTPQVQHPAMTWGWAQAIAWLCWIPFPILSAIQMSIVIYSLNLSNTQWSLVLPLSSGLLVTAVGRLSLNQAGRLRYILTGAVLLWLAAITVLFVAAALTLRQLLVTFVVLAVGLALIVVYLFLFGPWSHKLRGLVGNAVDALDVDAALRAYRSLTTTAPETKYTCPNSGCVNAMPDTSLLPVEPATTGGSDHSGTRADNAPALSKMVLGLGVAGTVAALTWLVRKRPVRRHPGPRL